MRLVDTSYGDKSLPDAPLTAQVAEPSHAFWSQVSTQDEDHSSGDALNEGPAYQWVSFSVDGQVSNLSPFTPLQSSIEATASQEFEFSPGHTYFALKEEFDAIPLMCFMAMKNRKMVCFFDTFGSLVSYKKLVCFKKSKPRNISLALFTCPAWLCNQAQHHLPQRRSYRCRRNCGSNGSCS